jgi:HPt (histidine-containing phosphotransfer) domain-containing protein
LALNTHFAMKSNDQLEPKAAPGSTASPDLASAIDLLWARFQPEIRKRVEALEIAASACSTHQLSDEQREAAHAAAHKLAGTLGIFNLSRGTDLAREFELLFSSERASDPTQSDRLNTIAAELRTIVDNRK